MILTRRFGALALRPALTVTETADERDRDQHVRDGQSTQARDESAA